MKIKTDKFELFMHPYVIDCIIDIDPKPIVSIQASKYRFMTNQIVIDFKSGVRLYVRAIFDPKSPEYIIGIEITDDEMDDNDFECSDPAALIAYTQLVECAKYLCP